MSFLIYDISFLVIFTIAFLIFFFVRRKHWKREGILFLYKTRIGLKIIDRIGKDHKKVFKILDWLVIITGYVLMAIGIWFLWKISYLFINVPDLAKSLKVPPIMPLIPYLPELFNVDYLPSFYFTYWIVSLAIIALSHEFAHGIFARNKNIPVHSTGFAFLGPFIGAFVEPDEKKMKKASIKNQLTILSAGTFANAVLVVLFYIVYLLFYVLAFTPSGYVFNTYGYSALNTSSIDSIKDNLQLNLTEIQVRNKTYFLDSTLKAQLDKNLSVIAAYDDSPAVRMQLKGAVIQAGDIKIKNQQDLAEFLQSKKPGENISLILKLNKTTNQEYNLTLGVHPFNSSLGYIGIASLKASPTGILSSVIYYATMFKNPTTYYEPLFASEFILFLEKLLWWIILLNISVAVMNMLPLGIFDGGRVFYLTILAIFKKESIAKKAFSIVSYIIFFLFLLMTLIWFFQTF